MSTKHTMGEEKELFWKWFKSDARKESIEDYMGLEEVVDYLISRLSHQREQVSKDLQAICNKCRTERGLAKAIGNYILTLKNKDNE